MLKKNSLEDQTSGFELVSIIQADHKGVVQTGFVLVVKKNVKQISHYVYRLLSDAQGTRFSLFSGTASVAPNLTVMALQAY